MQPNDVDLATYPTVITTDATDDTPTYAYSQYLGTTVPTDADGRTDDGAFRPQLIPMPSDTEEDETDPNDFSNGVRISTSPTPEPVDNRTSVPTEQSTGPVHTVFTANHGRDIGLPIHPGMHPGHGCISTRKPKNPSPLSTQHSHFASTSREEDQSPEETRQPLVVLPVQGTRGYFTSFEGLDTYTKIERRVAFTSTYAGLSLPDHLQFRITRVWRLLLDIVITTTITNMARDVYNYHCADLIDTFHNISNMVWKPPIQPGGNLDQFAVDLIRRMLSADIERYLVPIIETLQKGQRPILPAPHNNPRDFIFRQHEEHNDSVVPDRRHSDEFVKNVNKDTDEIRRLVTDVSDVLDRIQGNAEWITDGQRDGYPGKFFSHEETEVLNTAISDLDLHHYITPVEPQVKRGRSKKRRTTSFPDYTPPTTRSMTNASRRHRRQRCLHCKGNHESADHHSATAIPPVSHLPPRPSKRPRIGISRGNPRVFKAQPLPLPSKTLTLEQG